MTLYFEIKTSLYQALTIYPTAFLSGYFCYYAKSYPEQIFYLVEPPTMRKCLKIGCLGLSDLRYKKQEL